MIQNPKVGDIVIFNNTKKGCYALITEVLISGLCYIIILDDNVSFHNGTFLHIPINFSNDTSRYLVSISDLYNYDDNCQIIKDYVSAKKIDYITLHKIELLRNYACYTCKYNLNLLDPALAKRLTQCFNIAQVAKIINVQKNPKNLNFTIPDSFNIFENLHRDPLIKQLHKEIYNNILSIQE